jgi:hypothetical protein
MYCTPTKRPFTKRLLRRYVLLEEFLAFGRNDQANHTITEILWKSPTSDRTPRVLSRTCQPGAKDLHGHASEYFHEVQYSVLLGILDLGPQIIFLRNYLHKNTVFF